MKDILRRNLGFKLGSLFMALLLWLIAMNQGTIQKSSGDQTLTISLIPMGQTSNMIIMSKLPSVQVRLQWSNVSFNTKELYAYVDLSSAAEGKGNYDVHIDVPSGVKVLDIQPSKVDIQIDSVIEKVLPVQAVLTGKPSEGYTTGTPVLRPSSVSVRGASSVLGSLEKVVAEISVAEASQTIQVNSPILFRDGNGNPIFSSNLDANILTANPSSVEVILPVYPKELASKLVPIRVTSKGNPITGKILRGLIPTPGSITLIGDTKTLSSIDSVNIGSVDIAGLSEDKVFTINLDKVNLPQGVAISTGTNISVLAQITDQSVERVINSVPVQIRNLNSTLELEKGIDPVNITISGLPDVVNGVTADQIQLWVDATGMTEGVRDNVTLYWQTPSGVEAKTVPTVSFRLKNK